ncbi:MAG: cadherin-like beta sandwich domain-containing protein, partial [Myxococcota bacterium]
MQLISSRVRRCGAIVALAAFILGQDDCGPSGNPDLVLLELEDEGQNLIVGFDPQQRTYDVTVSQNPVTVKATPAEAGSTIQVSYLGANWVSPASGAAEHDVNVALGDTVIVVIVTTAGNAWRSYLINVTHDQPAMTKTINVACTSFVLEPNFYGLDLTVKTPSLPDGADSKPFTAEVGGVARFPRGILQPASNIVPGGIQQAVLVEVAVTAQVRSGATGSDVLLRENASAISPGLTSFCQFPLDQVCDPANDLDPDDPSMGNTDCLGGVQGVPCFAPRLFVDLPVSTDCGPGGACEAIGEGYAGGSSACDLNAFCIIDDLDIPLATATMDLTPDPSGEILLGFADQDVPD